MRTNYCLPIYSSRSFRVSRALRFHFFFSCLPSVCTLPLIRFNRAGQNATPDSQQTMYSPLSLSLSPSGLLQFGSVCSVVLALWWWWQSLELSALMILFGFFRFWKLRKYILYPICSPTLTLCMDVCVWIQYH